MGPLEKAVRFKKLNVQTCPVTAILVGDGMSGSNLERLTTQT